MIKVLVKVEKSVKEKIDMDEYDVNNAVQLYPGATIDTTDRDIIKKAKRYDLSYTGSEMSLDGSTSSTSNSFDMKFDPSGYRTKDPLRKRVFHTNPYITCSNCNLINFIDVVVLRTMIAVSDAGSKEMRLRNESLPPCLNCGRADCFVIGSHDFSTEIAARSGVAARKSRQELAAVIVIQRSYRRYLKRMYGAALSDAFLANKYLKFIAAKVINAAARGRLGRRTAKTERALLVLKSCHPLLIRYSLRTVPGRPKVFWYRNKEHLKLLYDDYLEFPARIAVERNIYELSLRVTARKSQLVVFVQKVFRGFLSRRMVKFFRSEIARLFQFSVAKAMQIQRLYRAHRVRLLIPKIIAEMKRERMMDSYLKESEMTMRKQRKTYINDRVAIAYKKERQYEKTARMTSRVEIDHGDPQNNSRLRAFWNSCYSDDIFTKKIDGLLSEVERVKFEEDCDINEDVDRKKFINDRINEKGPDGFGLRNQPRPKPTLHDSERLSISRIALTNVTAVVNAPPTAVVVSGKKKSFSNKMTRASSSSSTISTVTKADMFGDDDEGPNLPPQLSPGVPMEESDRSKRMRRYFEKEAIDIVERFVERNKHDFTVKDLQPRLKEYNTLRLSRPLTPSTSSGMNMGMASLKSSSSRSLLSDRSISSSNSSKKAVSKFDSSTDQSLARPLSTKRSSVTSSLVSHEPRVNTYDLFAENYKLMKPTKKKNVNKYSNRVIIEYKYPKNINDDYLMWLVEGEDD
eukprot:gene32863-42542_t